ncbi:MAG: YhdT family protein [Desulfovibrionaceae bacterium]
MNTQQDPRFKQANREALLALAAYGVYFVWWYVFSFGMGSADPETYSYPFGFPAWFFYSCILGYPLITVLLWLVVRCFFKDMPLDAEVPAATTNGEEGE